MPKGDLPRFTGKSNPAAAAGACKMSNLPGTTLGRTGFEATRPGYGAMEPDAR